MTNSIKIQWEKALEKIRKATSIAVLSHIRPDGDAYGCTLAMGLALAAQNKTIYLYIPNGVTTTYSHLPHIHRISPTPPCPPSIDLVISVDTSSKERLGENFLLWRRDVDINIDHHASNSLFAQCNIVDAEAPANAQLLYELFNQAGWSISPEVADCLFVGLSTDTGSFKYRGTTARTFQVAAALAQAGARVAELAELCYASYPVRRLLLLREILQQLELFCDNHIACSSITQLMYQRTGAQPEDTEGLIENITAIQSVELAILLEEKENNTVKISMRSKGRIDVNELCSALGGGGHRAAAGATIPGSLSDAHQTVLTLCMPKVQKLVDSKK